MRGYHNNPEATAEVLTEDGWFHTGDIGEIVNGYLKVTDRKKDLIKTSGGKYIAPQKIEVIFKAELPVGQPHRRARRGPQVRLGADHPRPGDDHRVGRASTTWPASRWSELAKEPAVIDLIEEHVEQLNSQLERWETIKKFVILPHDLTIEDGELTPSMKVRRKVVEKRYMPDLEKLYAD